MRRHIDRIEGACYERGYVYSFHFHLIWSTKYRRQIFTAPAPRQRDEGDPPSCG